ncbi:MAG: hypothetical protein KIT34_19010 [Cyanobacteria bacterium TGS_CYA1]|nr:hypothetical protein [Cyanobacteria bacterium TGS_CYA1]
MVNASPLILAPNTDEGKAKLTQEQEIERHELIMVSQAALRKSTETQRILKKLIPSGDPVKTQKLFETLLSMPMYCGSTSDGSSIDPSFGPYGSYPRPVMRDYYFSNFCILLDNPTYVESKREKISMIERRDFYNTFRDICDKVVGLYRDYKLMRKKLLNANEDFEDLKKMVADSKEADTTKQIEMQYILKKQQREIEEIGKQLEEFRKRLVEFTDEDAVNTLDKPVYTSNETEQDREQKQLQNLFKAAIQNSPDINFVLARINPSADLSKTAIILMKQPGYPGLALTDAHLEPDYPQIANPIKVPSYMLPAQGTKYSIKTSDSNYYLQNPFNVFNQILQPESARAKKTNISQAERIMLYNMIRNTSDKIIGYYRDYKLLRKKLSRTHSESDSKALQIARQHLVDISGSEAVDQLDKELDVELKSQ